MGVLGLGVGAGFPGIIVATGVADPADAHVPVFRWSCLGAGLLVALADYSLVKMLVGARVRHLNDFIVATGTALGSSSVDLQAGLSIQMLPVDSRDEFGIMGRTFNELLHTLQRSWDAQRCVHALTVAAGDRWEGSSDRASVCRHLLEVLVHHCRGLAWARVTLAGAVLAEVHGHASPTTAKVREPVREVEFVLEPGGARGRLAVVLNDEVAPAQELLLVAADTLALALSRYDLQALVDRQASIDDLTGLYNRRAGLKQMHVAASSSPQAALLLIDLDHFQTINDEFGHLAGDDVLRTVGTSCRQVFRATDIVCRYGGEELLVLITDSDEATVLAIAERIRLTVQTACYPALVRDPGRPVTISIGVRCWRGALGGAGGPGAADAGRSGPDAADALRTLVGHADAALYAAKSQGRNRIVVHPVVLPSPVPRDRVDAGLRP